MRYPATETAEKHDRIVQEASRLFRERGFEDVTVAEVMKKAGLTHGAFYSHFESKEALMAAAVEYAMQGGTPWREEKFPNAGGKTGLSGSVSNRKAQGHAWNWVPDGCIVGRNTERA